MALLRAIVGQPTVVFADEPTSNLDPGSTAAMLALLGRWQNGELFAACRDAASPHVARRADESFPLIDSSNRLLILVCHSVDTARSVGENFLLMNSNHCLEGGQAFHRDAWESWELTVRRVLEPASLPG
jgi:ABC-type polar amino acid transport system ATPase subunit